MICYNIFIGLKNHAELIKTKEFKDMRSADLYVFSKALDYYDDIFVEHDFPTYTEALIEAENYWDESDFDDFDDYQSELETKADEIYNDYIYEHLEFYIEEC